MNKVCWFILLAGLNLVGQTTDDVARLTPAISNALTSAAASRTLVNDLLSLANQEHRPTREQVAGFVNAMQGAAAGRQVSAPQAAVFSRSIVDVLRGSRSSNFALASQIRTTLTTLGVADRKANLIVRQLLVLGEAVRGPDDAPGGEDRFITAPLK